MNAAYYALVTAGLMFLVLHVFSAMVLSPVHSIAITGKVLTPWQRWCETVRVWVVLSMTVLFWINMALICVYIFMWIIRVSVLRAV